MTGGRLRGPAVTPSARRGMHGHLPDRPELRAAFLALGAGVAPGTGARRHRHARRRADAGTRAGRRAPDRGGTGARARGRWRAPALDVGTSHGNATSIRRARTPRPVGG
jgi:hypothetical protein